jgi:hypothetical protein
MLPGSLRLSFVALAVATAACTDTATSPSDRVGLTLQVSSARAEMIRPADGAARIEYTVCYAIGVANPVRRPITIQGIEFTVVRTDGSIVSSSGESSAIGQRLGGGVSNALYSCVLVFQEPGTAFPTAHTYRMRVEYTLDIGGTAAPHAVSAEGPFVTTAIARD